jgi:uncharacterized protein YaaW (UPF0174 family)
MANVLYIKYLFDFKGIKMPLNDTIFKRLNKATEKERIQICRDLRIDEKYKNDIYKISEEYRKAGGHSIANIFRDKHGLPYKQILIDVADKIKPDIGWTSYTLEDKYSEIHIENEIEKLIFEEIKKRWNNLSEKEKREKEREFKEKLKKYGSKKTNISLATIILGGVVGSASTPLAMTLFYSNFFASIYATIFGVSMRSLLLSGTALSIATLPITILIVGTPAYRKTIPATITMIRIRKRIENENKLNKITLRQIKKVTFSNLLKEWFTRHFELKSNLKIVSKSTM